MSSSALSLQQQGGAGVFADNGLLEPHQLDPANSESSSSQMELLPSGLETMEGSSGLREQQINEDHSNEDDAVLFLEDENVQT